MAAMRECTSERQEYIQKKTAKLKTQRPNRYSVAGGLRSAAGWLVAALLLSLAQAQLYAGIGQRPARVGDGIRFPIIEI